MSKTRVPFNPGQKKKAFSLVPFALVPGLMAGAPAIAAEGEEPLQLQTLEVVGTALKVDAPLVETPRPASVVTRDELDERNVQQLDETFRYRAGVLSGHYGADNDTDWFKIRGFDQSTYQDGLRIYREGYYVWMPEPFGLDRVEVLKGPSSVLYGEAPPGGVINAISKRPTEETQGLVEIQAGNRDHREVAIDTSGALNDSARARLVALYKYREGDIDQTENERYYLAPSIEVDLSDAATITFLASIQKDDAVPTNSFKLAYGTVEDTPYGKVDPSTNFGEPDYDKNDRLQSSIGYEFEYRFNDNWSAFQNLRYNQLELDLKSSYAARVNPANDREVERGLVYREGETRGLTIDNRVVGNFYTDRTENTLLVGVDYQNLATNGNEGDLFPPWTPALGDPLDMFDPEYGNFTPLDESLSSRRNIDKKQLGVYVQDQFRIDDQWVALAGARYDHAKVDNANETFASLVQADVEQVSYSGGLMYLADNGLSPYISYTESFRPLSGTDAQGRLLEPLEGQQLEVGVKYAPRGLDGYVTAAVYDLEEQNALVDGPVAQVQEGKRESKGFELEGVSYLTDQLQAVLAYSYIDAKSDKSDGTEGRTTQIPRHQASAWLDYSFEGPLNGLLLGGGVRYIGESYGSDNLGNEFRVSGYTLFDLVARYAITPQWQAQLNVNNLADEEYVASCNYWCYYGESRSIIGSLSYRW